MKVDLRPFGQRDCGSAQVTIGEHDTPSTPSDLKLKLRHADEQHAGCVLCLSFNISWPFGVFVPFEGGEWGYIWIFALTKADYTRVIYSRE